MLLSTGVRKAGVLLFLWCPKASTDGKASTSSATSLQAAVTHSGPEPTPRVREGGPPNLLTFLPPREKAHPTPERWHPQTSSWSLRTYRVQLGLSYPAPPAPHCLPLLAASSLTPAQGSNGLGPGGW